MTTNKYLAAVLAKMQDCVDKNDGHEKKIVGYATYYGMLCEFTDMLRAALSASAEPGYGLSSEQVATLLAEGLKPEEIGGPADLQHARVGELIRWFTRLAGKSANPKWAVRHAFELAYFVATSAGNRHIDIKPIREAAYKEGAMVSPADRGMLERIGFLHPMPAHAPAVQAEPPASVPDGYIPIGSAPHPERNACVVYWHTSDNGGFPAIADEWRDEHHLAFASHWHPSASTSPTTPDPK